MQNPPYSFVVITLVVVTLEVNTLVAVALEVSMWVVEVMVSILELNSSVVHPYPSYFEDLTLVAILGVGLEAEIHQVHSQDFEVKPSSHPCQA